MNSSKWIPTTLVIACSAAASTSGIPAGATATKPGLVGCVPLLDGGVDPGCYTASGSYAPPNITPSCAKPGGPATGAADSHCNGVPPQVVVAASCGVMPTPDAGADAAAAEAGTADAGPMPAPGRCGENGPDYGATMYGTEGDDDDCKYHVTYSTAPICESDGVYLVVTAHYLTRDSAPLTAACTFAELCLNDSHVIPSADYRPPTGKQVVVEGPPGTYTIGPVEFDQPGTWTVRFHFNEICCDVADSSPHGHAAFFVDVP